MTLTVSHTISMGHRLPSYKGRCSSPHGHNMRVEVDVAELDNGFIDFKVIAKHLEDVLDPLDHAMVLDFTDPLAKVLLDMKFRVFTTEGEPTTERIARHILSQMQLLVPSTFDVRVFETERYSVETTR